MTLKEYEDQRNAEEMNKLIDEYDLREAIRKAEVRYNEEVAAQCTAYHASKMKDKQAFIDEYILLVQKYNLAIYGDDNGTYVDSIFTEGISYHDKLLRAADETNR
jgi:hypothetical protein